MPFGTIRNKKSPPIQFPKTQNQSYKKKEETISKPFLKGKNTSFEVKIHFETHLYLLHLKIGSHYLQKKNKKRLVNRFLKKKIQVSKWNLEASYVLIYRWNHFRTYLISLLRSHWSNDDKSASDRSPIVFPIGFLLDADLRILDHIYDCRSWSINGGNRSTIAPNRTDYW